MASNLKPLRTGILTGLFNDYFEEQSQFIGLAAAPPLWVDSLEGQYKAAVRPATLHTEEEGHDPFTSISWEAPSRPVRDSFETRSFRNERYSEHYMIDRNTALSAQKTDGIDLEDRAARVLAGVHRARHEMIVARKYGDPANFGVTDTVTYELLMQAVEQAAGDFGRAQRIALVMPPSAAIKLRQTQAFRDSIGGGNTGIVGTQSDLSTWLSESYGVELYVGTGRFVDNRATPGTTTTTRIWEAAASSSDWAAVVGLSDGQSLDPSFLRTVAFTETFDDPAIGVAWSEVLEDPRGVKALAESVYQVDVGDKSLGARFALTGA